VNFHLGFFYPATLTKRCTESPLSPQICGGLWRSVLVEIVGVMVVAICELPVRRTKIVATGFSFCPANRASSPVIWNLKLERISIADRNGHAESFDEFTDSYIITPLNMFTWQSPSNHRMKRT
jgi:hypothetical protein